MTTLRTHINGHWEVFVRTLIAILAGSLGSAVTLLSAGLWLGNVKAHVDSVEIHPTPSRQEAATRLVIDREVAPILLRIEYRLGEIERELKKPDRR